MPSNALRDRAESPEGRAVARFLALVVVLAVLPDGVVVFGVDARRVWLVVVLVAGLGLLGGLLSRVVAPATALGVTGALGGSASPGLTITWLADRTRRRPEFAPLHAAAGAVAATMLFPRNLFVVAIVDPALARSLLVPFAGMTAVAATVAGVLWTRTRSRTPPAGDPVTPFRLRSALAFGAGVAVLLAVANVSGVTVPETATRAGVVLLTAAELAAYVLVTRSVGAGLLARRLAVVLLGSGGTGLALVLLG